MSNVQSAPFSLESTAFFEVIPPPRCAFRANVVRTFRSTTQYDIFCFQQGMLFLHNPNPVEESKRRVANGAAFGGLVGGALASIGGDMIDSLNQNDTYYNSLENLSLLADEELVNLAAKRRLSFAANYEEMESGVALPPAQWFGGNLAGSLRMKIRSIGKVTLEFAAPSSMMIAIQALEKRIGDRLDVQVHWNPHKSCYEPN